MRALYHTLSTMRYLGIDYGSKKVGLALSDENGTMGFPHAVMPNTPRLADELCALIEREGVSAIVVGDSVNFEGKENSIAQDARALGEQLAERARIPLFFEPETLTSAEARRAHGHTHREHVDHSAAALILTSYLSRTHHE